MKPQQLVADTTAFVNAIKGGDLEQAKQLFPTTRTHYETIEPVAESFGDLDPEIDARVNDVPADAVQGVPPHRAAAVGRRATWTAWRPSPTSCSTT